jgi:energy-coupling factor transporter ATP-binding protein EcfA2
VHICGLRIDRFGVWSDLELNNFSNGLNVVFGPNGSGKTTLVQFIRAMLCGFDETVRQRYRTADGRCLGGTLTVQSRSGKQTIVRHDTGDRIGRLVVEGDDGTAQPTSRVQDLLAHIPPAIFDRILLAGIQHAAEIDRLIDEALAQGFDLLGSPTELRQVRDLQERLQADRRLLAESTLPDTGLPELRDQRYRLQAELETVRGTVHGHRESLYQRLVSLAEEISALEDEIDELTREADALQAELTGCDAEQRRLEETLRETRLREEQLAGQRRDQLCELDVQLDRWRGVLRDIESRRHRLAGQHGANEVPASRLEGDPRWVLRRFEERLEKLQETLLITCGDHDPDGCQCRTLRDALGPVLQALREDVYRLCQELSHWELSAQRVECSSELGQLRRCETELSQALQMLTLRREALLAEAAGRPLDEPKSRDLSHGPFCQCASHPERTDGADRLLPLPNRDEERLATLQAESLRRTRRLEELRDDVAALQEESQELRQRRQHLQREAAADAELARMEAQQRELDGVLEQLREAEKHQQLQAAVARGEAELRLLEATLRDSSVLREASDLLRRLTDGDLQRISLTAERAVVVHNRQGDHLTCQQLGSGGRDQVYLSLCLALVAAYGRQGTRLPLILGDAFLNIDARGTEAAAALLRDFGQRGHQILLFTRHLQLADLFRSLGVPVRHLPPTGAAADLSDQKCREINRVLSAIAAETTAPEEAIDLRAWNSEEFPGELTDRVRLKQTVEVLAPALPSDESAAEYFLTESSPIQDAPSIDSATAERLRKVGVLIVRDLLRLKSEEAAEQLRYAGITASMIERWQAEALLACRVVRLRPYDARILVACGITDPDQLARTEATELLRRVEAFSATSLGQVLLRAGNRYELGRLADWIRAARRLHPGRHLPRETATSRPADETSPRNRAPRPDRKRDQTSDRREHERDRNRDRVPATSRPHTPAEATPRVLRMEGAGGEWRFYLAVTDAVEDAPSIGPRLAEQFYQIGIKTIDDLLRADPEQAARGLGNRRVTAELVRQWQQQSMLACRVPELRGHDAQILVACGVTEPEQLAQSSPADLWQRVQPFADSVEGKRIVRSGKAPDFEEVTDWIRWATHARTLRAA